MGLGFFGGGSLGFRATFGVWGGVLYSADPPVCPPLKPQSNPPSFSTQAAPLLGSLGWDGGGPWDWGFLGGGLWDLGEYLGSGGGSFGNADPPPLCPPPNPQSSPPPPPFSTPAAPQLGSLGWGGFHGIGVFFGGVLGISGYIWGLGKGSFGNADPPPLFAPPPIPNPAPPPLLAHQQLHNWNP